MEELDMISHIMLTKNVPNFNSTDDEEILAGDLNLAAINKDLLKLGKNLKKLVEKMQLEDIDRLTKIEKYSDS